MNELLFAGGAEPIKINMKRIRTPNAALKAIRDALGLSQGEFGRRAGIQQSTIARLESGEIPTSTLHAKKLADAYGRDERDFFAASEGFAPVDDAQLVAQATVIARRLAGDDATWLPLIAALAYVFLDLERRGRSISDEDTLETIESMIRRFQSGG